MRSCRSAEYPRGLADPFHFRPSVDLARERFATCAIVGNSGSLLRQERGHEIDAHEMVYRFNQAPLKGYEKHVGSRCTHESLNGYWVKQVRRNCGRVLFFAGVWLTCQPPPAPLCCARAPGFGREEGLQVELAAEGHGDGGLRALRARRLWLEGQDPDRGEGRLVAAEVSCR